MRCIYCQKEQKGKPHVAHIFPEGLLGASQLILKDGQVCLQCNNWTSTLETFLIKEIGFLGFLTGTGITKRGKPKRIDQLGIAGSRDKQNPWIFINQSSRVIAAPDGTRVSPDKLGKIKMTKPEDIGNGYVSFKVKQKFRTNKQFCRAITKIAFEGICYFWGENKCNESRFDPIRDYVMKGTGARSFIVPKNLTFNAPANSSFMPKAQITVDKNSNNHNPVVIVQLGFPFVVDLSEEGNFLRNISMILPSEVQNQWTIFRDDHLKGKK
ncbi:MAG TPA: hypothetical protein QF468_02590 [Nitrospinota bacterium]|nr:hypothetical protein [Nitrospinota bacterium]|tara:strand:- start:1032 stop:1835 length:804 start_codon:yes stop_codon:yes gene_type:complete